MIHRQQPRRRIPAGKLLHMMQGVADGIAHLHAHNPPVLHCDVKPSNIFLSACAASAVCRSCSV
jgi:serine/threonine protein kinase